MKNILFIFIASLLLLADTSLLAQSSVVDLSLDHNLSTRWLMLRNGALFSGKITENSGRYTVQIDAKTQMTFDPSRVWVVADSATEICEFNRARMRPGDTAAQIDFVRWCLTHRLWEEAHRELDSLKSRGVPESQLKGLASALAAAQQGPAPVVDVTTALPKLPPSTSMPLTTPTGTGTGAPAASSPNRPGTSQTTSLSVAPSNAVPLAHELQTTPKLNMPSKAAQPVTGADPAMSPSATEQPSPIVNSVFSFFDQPGFQNDQRVQEAIDGRVQQTAVNQFNESVHWAVVQACAGCHYPENEKLAQASSFTLEIPSAKHKATLEQTRHNLEQLLSLINRENPGNSRLLTLLSQPHGPLKAAPVAVDSVDYREITQWVYRSGIGKSGRDFESHNIQATAETVDNVPATASDLTVPSDKFQLPRLAPGSLGPEVDPSRPYDPEPFNRMYHPNQAPNAVISDRQVDKPQREVPSQLEKPDTSVRLPLPSGIPRIRREPALPPSAPIPGGGSR
ncbi:MAG: hypothetical protein JNL67_02690 [Planctomycetaceae bacterium]|nr:hypothetical protein [Planctomycetaceae bacterium]